MFVLKFHLNVILEGVLGSKAINRPVGLVIVQKVRWKYRHLHHVAIAFVREYRQGRQEKKGEEGVTGYFALGLTLLGAAAALSIKDRHILIEQSLWYNN